ncbi:MAG: hypothetical protein KY394_03610 [Actinobacteria bacterium]|nr:hypothetical protein [Actinomycetota bacterium]
MANYALAGQILAERRREAEHRRFVAELRAAARAAGDRSRVTLRDRWTLEWASNGFTGKPVTLVNVSTGEKTTGRDPASWDRAMGRAVRSVAADPRQLVGASLDDRAIPGSITT